MFKKLQIEGSATDTQRESPKRCEYYGLTLWYHGIYRAGMLYRIRISLRKEHANPDMPGKIILERDYAVDKDITLTKSNAIPADLLHGMISNALFRRSFFRAICAVPIWRGESPALTHWIHGSDCNL